ncbi:hypothetical protein MY1884_007095 [Beauveria asiatica]
MASAIGERADDASVNGIPPNAVAQDDNKLSGLMTASEKGKADLTATCPPNYPKYCPAFNFCCPSRAIGCCQRACCLPGATQSYGGDYSDSSQNGADTILGALSLAISARRESACAATFDTIAARAARRRAPEFEVHRHAGATRRAWRWP